MEFYITNFANLRHLKPNMIPISTCLSDPIFFHNNTRNKKICFIDKNGVMNGIREEILSPKFISQEYCVCSKTCSFKSIIPECPFLKAYSEYLDTINFNDLLSELSRTAEEVRLVTQFDGEPIIVLLVYESETNLCSERIPLQNLFRKYGINLKNFKK